MSLNDERDTALNYDSVVITAIAAYANGIMANAFEAAERPSSFGRSDRDQLTRLALFLGDEIATTIERQLVDNLTAALKGDGAVIAESTSAAVDELAKRREAR